MNRGDSNVSNIGRPGHTGLVRFAYNPTNQGKTMGRLRRHFTRGIHEVERDQKESTSERNVALRGLIFLRSELTGK